MKNTKTFTTENLTAAEIIETINDNIQTITGDVLTTALNTAKAHLVSENKAIKADKIADLVGYAERIDLLFDEYLNNPFYFTMIITQDKATSEYKFAKRKKMLSFVSLDAAYKKEYKRHLCYDSDFWRLNCKFARDVIKYANSNINSDIAPSVNALEKSLNAVTVALLGEFAPKMQKKDVKAIAAACLKNKFMEFKTVNEKDFLNLVIRSIGIRKAGAKYTVETNYKYNVDGSKMSKKAATK